SGVCRLSWTPGQATTASWKTFQPSDGLPSGEVRAVEAGTSPSFVWAGTGEGLVLADFQNLQVISSFGSAEGLPADDVQSLAVSRDGTVYVGTTGGLAWIEDSSVFQSELVQGDVQMLCVDNLSSLWASSPDALFRLRPDGSVEEYNTYNSPLQSLNIRHAACDYDQGLLYLVTDHGLWRLHLEQGLEGNIRSASVFPNPFLPGDGYDLGVAGLPDQPFDFRVFDLTGNLVYESASQSRDSFAWNGIDSQGSPIASGTYIVELVQEGNSVFIKLAVVR
ncbi:MAG: T9SS type A sorting domain-containing protein, partial [Candidatus Aegiribacteria sp.]|nr:T9SS type A sorting domain-containing protein [Candidatus Aegiribacteria sp.]MBD3294759.1 T9SS type A sorting domain-containing protein [Candidatus Fermentibacteria bacterium]